MRTADEAYKDLTKRGRSAAQIRAVAVARGDEKLQQLAEDAILEEDALSGAAVFA